MARAEASDAKHWRMWLSIEEQHGPEAVGRDCTRSGVDRADGPARRSQRGEHPYARLRNYRRSAASTVQHVVRAVSAVVQRQPGKHGTLRDVIARLSDVGRNGVRYRLSAADPSDRRRVSQREEQRGIGAGGRRGQPLGNRRQGGRTQGDSSATWDARGFSRARRGSAVARHGGGAGHCVSVFAGPSVCERASGVVSQAARRDDSIRREPAEKISGHLSVRFRVRELAGAVARAAERVCVLVRSGRARAFASTIRTPSRLDFGSGRSRRSRSSIRN